jgi:hypothetical protein
MGPAKARAKADENGRRSGPVAGLFPAWFWLKIPLEQKVIICYCLRRRSIEN